jgi:hypothetical protein
MSWTLNIIYSIIAITAFVLVKLIQLKFSPRPALFDELDSVHPSPQWCPPTFARNVTTSILRFPQYTNEGYQKFSKALDRPFALLTPWVRGATVRPDKIKDSEWTNLHGLLETTQLTYVVDDANVYQNLVHFDVVRKHMAPSDMRRLATVTAEETDLAFRDIWGTSKAWKTIKGWDECGRIISRASQRFLVGLPLSRDETMLETSRLYANALLVGGAIINCFPPWMRGVVAPLIAIRARYFQSRYVKMLVPVVKERIRQYEAGLYKESDEVCQATIGNFNCPI